jgi:hypothetical protein
MMMHTRLRPGRLGALASRSGSVESLREFPPDVATVIVRGGADVLEHSAVWLELAEPVGFLPCCRGRRCCHRSCRRRYSLTVLHASTAARNRFTGCGARDELAGQGALRHRLRTLLDIAHSIAARVPRRLTLHLFSDGQAHSQLQQAVGDIHAEIRLYDPAEAAEHKLARRTQTLDDSFDVVNPWLLWIRDSLQGRGVDVVHFVCHGYLSSGRGALSFASSPPLDSDNALLPVRRVGQLSSFLDQIGAWSLAVTGPPYNYSMAALRELCDSVARTAPRYVLAHDSDLDPGPSYTDLADEYGFLYQTSGTMPVPPVARSVACWIHPRLVEYANAAEPGGDALLSSDGHSIVFGEETKQLLDSDDTPAWPAANVRTVERLQARWLNQSGTTSESGVAPDIAAAALRNVTPS